MNQQNTPKRRKPSAKAKRSAARLNAVQALYQMFQTQKSVDDVLQEYKTTRYRIPLEDIDFVEADLSLLEELVRGATEKTEEIKATIESAQDKDRRLESFELLIQAILMVGTYELMFNDTYDTALVINEYVDVASAFYDDKQPQIINAVLDRIAKVVR